LRAKEDSCLTLIDRPGFEELSGDTCYETTGNGWVEVDENPYAGATWFERWLPSSTHTFYSTITSSYGLTK